MIDAMPPTQIAPQPLTKPAAGVIATSPTIMPLTPPSRLGLRPVTRSQVTHTRNATAVARLVLSTAAAAEFAAEYGSPPLKPFQPNHRRPAPTATIATLFGASISRSLWRRGPITAAATKPDTPAD